MPETQFDLFQNKTIQSPETQAIKYAGSKLKILPYIIDVISSLDVKNVLDGFSGSTRVSQAFAKLGYNTTSNDLSVWSKTFATAFLLNKNEKKHYKNIIDHLNSLEGHEGWFSQHYGGISNSEQRFPFQKKNTMRLDSIREEIEKMGLTEIEKCVALTSLIFALDSVDSTLGHYVAYLKDWSPRSYNELTLKIPSLFIPTGQNRVLQNDVFDVIDNNEFDFAYFDPPYGSNNEKMPPSRVRYNSYYHIWTTVILNDKPDIFGAAKRREDSRDTVSSSVFEEFRKDKDGHFIAMKAIKNVIEKTKSRYILLSYSSGGRATKTELYDILCSSGKLLKAIEIDYKKNVMANMRWTNEWINSDGKHTELLFLIEKK